MLDQKIVAPGSDREGRQIEVDVDNVLQAVQVGFLLRKGMLGIIGNPDGVAVGILGLLVLIAAQTAKSSLQTRIRKRNGNLVDHDLQTLVDDRVDGIVQEVDLLIDAGNIGLNKLRNTIERRALLLVISTGDHQIDEFCNVFVDRLGQIKLILRQLGMYETGKIGLRKLRNIKVFADVHKVGKDGAEIERAVTDLLDDACIVRKELKNLQEDVGVRRTGVASLRALQKRGEVQILDVALQRAEKGLDLSVQVGHGF